MSVCTLQMCMHCKGYFTVAHECQSLYEEYEGYGNNTTASKLSL